MSVVGLKLGAVPPVRESDPKTTVVNPYGETHEVKNLFVADASLLPTSIGYNPSETVYALASYISDRIIAGLDAETFETQVEKGAAWVGSPDDIGDAIAAYRERVGHFESASLQVNFNTISGAEALRSMRLFAERVIPRFGTSRAA